MSSESVHFTSVDDEKLINFVKTNEVLYNIECNDYRKGQLKKRLWDEMGATLGKSGTDCCKRWSYVRDYYVRRRGKPGSGSGGEAAKKRSDLLSFLDSIPSSKRNLKTNVVDDEFHQNNIGSVEKDGFMGDKKYKKITRSEERLQLLKEIAQSTTVQNELDETDHFFNSMAKIVKKLPRYEQIKLRMQIGSLVGNAELRSISKEPILTSDSTGPDSTPSTSLRNSMLSPNNK